MKRWRSSELERCRTTSWLGAGAQYWFRRLVSQSLVEKLREFGIIEGMMVGITLLIGATGSASRNGNNQRYKWSPLQAEGIVLPIISLASTTTSTMSPEESEQITLAGTVSFHNIAILIFTTASFGKQHIYKKLMERGICLIVATRGLPTGFHY